MYGFLRKNNKKLMAIFAAFLMVSFIADRGASRSMRERNDPVAATLVGDDKLRASEFRDAEQEWKMLTQLRSSRGGGGFGAFPIAYRLGPYAFSEIQRHPRLFLLLQ